MLPYQTTLRRLQTGGREIGARRWHITRSACCRPQRPETDGGGNVRAADWQMAQRSHRALVDVGCSLLAGLQSMPVIKAAAMVSGHVSIYHPACR